MSEKPTLPNYVITCGDEGVQINEGTRLAFVGSGFRLTGFSEAVVALQQLLGVGSMSVVSQEENDWLKQTLELVDWKQVNAMSQQHTEALADKEGLTYAGNLTFTDPKQLKHGIKGHMVRPHNVHVANKICFTLAGGEQTYNLGNYLISAEWVHLLPKKKAEQLIKIQVEFYQKLANRPVTFVFEEAGILGEKIASKNKKVLEKMGIA